MVKLIVLSRGKTLLGVPGPGLGIIRSLRCIGGSALGVNFKSVLFVSRDLSAILIILLLFMKEIKRYEDCKGDDAFDLVEYAINNRFRLDKLMKVAKRHSIQVTPLGEKLLLEKASFEHMLSMETKYQEKIAQRRKETAVARAKRFKEYEEFCRRQAEKRVPPAKQGRIDKPLDQND
jgi:hypothetical protein